MPVSCSEMDELDCRRPGEKRRRRVYGGVTDPICPSLYKKHFYILNTFNPQKKKKKDYVRWIL